MGLGIKSLQAGVKILLDASTMQGGEAPPLLFSTGKRALNL